MAVEIAVQPSPVQMPMAVQLPLQQSQASMVQFQLGPCNGQTYCRRRSGVESRGDVDEFMQASIYLFLVAQEVTLRFLLTT